MAVLNVRRHAYTIGRGGKRGYPQGRLIFYSWVKPATMMCNQFSYSNAEIVSHAFKNLGRGPLVGMTTFGAVISTGAYGFPAHRAAPIAIRTAKRFLDGAASPLSRIIFVLFDSRTFPAFESTLKRAQ